MKKKLLTIAISLSMILTMAIPCLTIEGFAESSEYSHGTLEDATDIELEENSAGISYGLNFTENADDNVRIYKVVSARSGWYYITAFSSENHTITLDDGPDVDPIYSYGGVNFFEAGKAYYFRAHDYADHSQGICHIDFDVTRIETNTLDKKYYDINYVIDENVIPEFARKAIPNLMPYVPFVPDETAEYFFESWDSYEHKLNMNVYDDKGMKVEVCANNVDEISAQLEAGRTYFVLVEDCADSAIDECSVYLAVRKRDFDVANECIFSMLTNYVYTGSPIIPTFDYAFDLHTGVNLIEGVDYTIECINNVEPGTATMIIKGIGKYTGQTEFDYLIYMTKEQEIENAEVLTTVSPVTFTYDESVFDDLSDVYYLKYMKFTPAETGSYLLTLLCPDYQPIFTRTNLVVYEEGTPEPDFYKWFVSMSNTAAWQKFEAGKTYIIKYEINRATLQGNPLTITANIRKHTHKAQEYVNFVATDTSWGEGGVLCEECGYNVSEFECAPYKSATLSYLATTYSGSAKKPTVTVKDINGKTISSKYYTVSYANNTKVGKATVTIKFKGRYSGKLTKTFKINPKGTSIASLTAVSKGFTVKWKKQATQTTGYQIRYSTKSSMASAKTVTVSKNTTLSKKVTKLTAKKKYYVQVRTYKTVSGTKYYSAWSTKKSVTTKE